MNTLQARIQKQRKGKTGSVLLRSPSQGLPAAGAGAALLISGLFLANSPCISSRQGRGSRRQVLKPPGSHSAPDACIFL